MPMTGILLPMPRIGIPLTNGLKAYFYIPGSTSKRDTFTTEALSVANNNPLSANSAGLFPAVFLDPTLGYKLVIAPSTDADPPTSPVFSQDPVYLPAMALPVVLSKVAADSPYTVTQADGFDVIILADATSGAITISLLTAIGNTGKRVTVKKIDASANAVTIDPNGSQTDDGSATQVLSTQYDALTQVSDGANWKIVGKVGVSVTTPTSICDGRLTLTSVTPVTTADVTAATSVYYTPYTGNRIALYDGASWNVRTFTELTLSLSGFTASKPYDVFAYDNAGVVTLEALVWTNPTTRATALALQNGVLSKTGALTRRYLGTIYINSSGGQTDDALATRHVCNYYHAVLRPLRKPAADASWTYTTATWHQANGNPANQVTWVSGYNEYPVTLRALGCFRNGATLTEAGIGIGVDVTNAPHANSLGGSASSAVIDGFVEVSSVAEVFAGVGLHTGALLEISEAANTTTWLGTSAVVSTQIPAGILGFCWG